MSDNDLRKQVEKAEDMVKAASGALDNNTESEKLREPLKTNYTHDSGLLRNPTVLNEGANMLDEFEINNMKEKND